METLFDYSAGGGRLGSTRSDEAFAGKAGPDRRFLPGPLDLQKTEARANTAVYRPLPPERLYLSEDERVALLAGRATLRLSMFGPIEGDLASIDGGGRRGRDFSDVRATRAAELYDDIRDYMVRAPRMAAARWWRLFRRLAPAPDVDPGGARIDRLVPVDNWADAGKLPKAETAVAVLALETGFTAPIPASCRSRTYWATGWPGRRRSGGAATSSPSMSASWPRATWWSMPSTASAAMPGWRP